MTRWFRNWWRGYSQADVSSLMDKLIQHGRPGSMIILTEREVRALRTIHIVKPGVYTVAESEVHG